MFYKKLLRILNLFTKTHLSTIIAREQKLHDICEKKKLKLKDITCAMGIPNITNLLNNLPKIVVDFKFRRRVVKRHRGVDTTSRRGATKNIRISMVYISVATLQKRQFHIASPKV